MSDELPAPDVIDLLLEQHARIEELFHEVFTSAGEEQREAFHRLGSVLAHATHEERYEFTRLREANARATLVALAPAVRAAEALAPTRPHPGVESATMNTLVG